MYLYHFLRGKVIFFSRTSALRVWNTILQISARHLLPKKKKKKKKLRKLADTTKVKRQLLGLISWLSNHCPLKHSGEIERVCVFVQVHGSRFTPQTF
jgi:hypothetical protein